jgi:hypothetical protein
VLIQHYFPHLLPPRTCSVLPARSQVINPLLVRRLGVRPRLLGRAARTLVKDITGIDRIFLILLCGMSILHGRLRDTS